MSIIRPLKPQVAYPAKALIKEISYQSPNTRLISVFGQHTIEVIPTAEIIYFKSDSNYTRIMLIDGKEVVASRTLKKFEEKLEGHFLRIHNSYLINPSCIRSLDLRTNTLLLGINVKLPVSRTRKPLLIKYLKNL